MRESTSFLVGVDIPVAGFCGKPDLQAPVVPAQLSGPVSFFSQGPFEVALRLLALGLRMAFSSLLWGSL